MTSPDLADRGPRDTAARLRDLLAELEDAAPALRSDPQADRQLALCAEVEAILRMRSAVRAAQQGA